MAQLTILDFRSKIQNSRRAAQASLELTLAMMGAILLLFGSLKVFLWVNERIISRQREYECRRLEAGGGTRPANETCIARTTGPLRIFQ